MGQLKFYKISQCSLWTTSAARLVLLKYMQQVLQTPGARLLYTGILFCDLIISFSSLIFFVDTDSIIVQHVKGNEPIKSGQMLGEMQREYVDWQIAEFCCGGPKQYAFHLRNRTSGEDKYIRKIRVGKRIPILFTKKLYKIFRA